MMVGVKLEGDVMWVRPYGPRLDAAVTPAFKSAVANGMTGPVRVTILNATSLNFVDSTGLGAIVGVMKQMQQNGTLAIVEPSVNFMRLLEMTGLNKVFKIYDNLGEAEAELVR